MLFTMHFGGNKTQVCYCKESQRLLRNDDWEEKKKDVKVASYRHAQNLFVFLSFPRKTRSLIWDQQLQLHSKVARIYSPTAPMWPFWAAIMRGVFPAWSAAFTWALWLRRSWRHSTWSAKAAAWRGVLWGKLTWPQLLLNNYNIPIYLPSQEPESTRWFGYFFLRTSKVITRGKPQ